MRLNTYFVISALLALSGAYYLYARQEVTKPANSKPLAPASPPKPQYPSFKPALDFDEKESITKKDKKLSLFGWKIFNSILTIDNENYEILEKIGGGGNGRVKRAKNLKTSKEVVIKIMKSLPSNEDDMKLQVRNNLNNIGKLLDYGRIIKNSGTVNEKEKHYYVMEQVEGINFFDVLYEQRAFNKKRVLAFDDQLNYAIKFLETFNEYHDRNYVIGDVKPSNYIWNKNEEKMVRVDLDDTQIEKKGIRCAITLGYLAPETTDYHYSLASERYSAGVLLMEIFSTYEAEKVEYRRPNESPGFIQPNLQSYRDTEPECILDKAVWNICKDMIKINPQQRKTIKQAIRELESLKKNYNDEIVNKRTAYKQHQQRVADFDKDKIDTVYDLILIYNSLQHAGKISYINKAHSKESEQKLRDIKKRFLELARNDAKKLAGTRNNVTLENFKEALINIKKEADEKKYYYALTRMLNHQRNVWWDFIFNFDGTQATTCRKFTLATDTNNTKAAESAAKYLMEYNPTSKCVF